MPERFPHMYAAESEIWRRWLRIHEREYLRFEYDTHVGKPWPEHLTLPEKWRRGAEAVYLKRIDVVGFKQESVTIFEVKPHAGLGSLGQILGYLSLYEEQFAPSEELRGAIVTELTDPNIERILEEHGIELYILPEG